MLIELGGLLVVSAVMAGIAIVASKNTGKSTPKRDPIKDYTIIKSALIRFRKEKMGLVPEIVDLQAYLEEGQQIDWKAYRLSQDEKYLIFSAEGIGDPQQIANQVGGDSYVMGNSVFLSFSTIQSKKEDDQEPVAAFKVFPEVINTMTNVVYDTSECKALDGEIVEYKWEKAQQNYDIPGDYLIKLRIKDKLGRWSKPAEKKIKVVREEGYALVAAGGTSLFVIHKDGKVDVQGANAYGQLGNGTINAYRDREINPLLHSVVDIVATDYHTIVRKVNGTVYSFGRNEMGQLGNGTKGDMKTPKEIWGIKNVVQIGAGEAFSAALDAYGRVYTWGDNTHGQLGGERTGSREMPMHLEVLTEIRGLAVGYNYAMAIRQDGTVYAWGDNQHGQLGLGFKSKQSEVTITSLKKVDKIVCGRGFAFAIDTKGDVSGWGLNQKNQLGIQGQNEFMFPVDIPGLKHIIDIKTYGNYSIALDDKGRIYTWGQNNVLSDTYPERPVRLDFLPLAISIAAADRYAYLLTADGRVIQWSGDSGAMEELSLKATQASFDQQG